MISMTLPQYRRGECTIDGHVVRMRRTCTELLAVLLVADRFLSHSELTEAVWPDPDFEPEFARNTIEQSILRLRRNGVVIECQYSFGWRIPRDAREAEPQRLAA